MQKDDWIKIVDAAPHHMQIIKVFIDNPYFGSGEREGNAVFLAFDDNFYDSEEQIQLHYVTKWKPANETIKNHVYNTFG